MIQRESLIESDFFRSSRRRRCFGHYVHKICSILAHLQHRQMLSTWEHHARAKYDKNLTLKPDYFQLLTGFGRRYRNAVGSDHKTIDAVLFIEDTFFRHLRFVFFEVMRLNDR